MPCAAVCKSRVQAEFHSLFNIKVDAVVAWYSSHLSGYKKISGHEANSSQTAFYSADGMIVIIVTGDVGKTLLHVPPPMNGINRSPPRNDRSSDARNDGSPRVLILLFSLLSSLAKRKISFCRLVLPETARALVSVLQPTSRALPITYSFFGKKQPENYLSSPKTT